MLNKELQIMSYEKKKQIFDKMVHTAIQESRARGQRENRQAIEKKVRKIIQKTQK